METAPHYGEGPTYAETAMDVLIGILILIVMYFVVPGAIIGGALFALRPRDRRRARAAQSASAGNGRRP